MRLLLLLFFACSLLADVTITRDRWGVPHIEGRTDADAVYGLMYAQAEDNFWQLEEDYIRIVGRAAGLYGEEGVGADVGGRMFGINRQAEDEYASARPKTKAL